MQIEVGFTTGNVSISQFGSRMAKYGIRRVRVGGPSGPTPYRHARNDAVRLWADYTAEMAAQPSLFGPTGPSVHIWAL